MTSRNDITGDKIQTKVTSDTYRNNYDTIFNQNKTYRIPVDLLISAATPELAEDAAKFFMTLAHKDYKHQFDITEYEFPVGFPNEPDGD